MIEKRWRQDRDGRKYYVWRVRVDGKHGERSKTLPRGATKRDAEQLELRMKTLVRVGRIDDLDAGAEPLRDFFAYWWEVYAGPNLALSTLESYKVVWNRHLNRRLGQLPLREITPQTVSRLRADLEADGIQPPTIHRALAILQGVFERAVEWERVPVNPVKAVKKPQVIRERAIRALAPSEVEAIRAELIKAEKYRDAAIVSCLAYSGPRPIELLRSPLQWRDVGKQTLLYCQSKTRRTQRHVDLCGPLKKDLAEWRIRSGSPAARSPVFPNPAGDTWSDSTYRSWRRNTYTPAAEDAGVQITNPYALRHTYASMLIHAGELTVVEIAAQLGHSTETLLANYGHIIAELSGEQIPIDEQIRRARSKKARRAV